LALVLIIFFIAAYMRYAPRFRKDEDGAAWCTRIESYPTARGGAASCMVDVTQAVPGRATPPVTCRRPSARSAARQPGTPGGSRRLASA
jgi:hypothetical protein